MATFDLFRNKGLFNNEQFRNNNSDKTIHKICLKSGVFTSAILILTFFSLCAVSGLLEINQLSAINMFILALGVFFVLRNMSGTGKAGSIDYFEGFKVGMYASIIAVLIHSLFLFIYTFFSPSVLIGNGHIFGAASNPLTVASVTLLEGIPAAFIITFCIMQYFKKDAY